MMKNDELIEIIAKAIWADVADGHNSWVDLCDLEKKDLAGQSEAALKAIKGAGLAVVPIELGKYADAYFSDLELHTPSLEERLPETKIMRGREVWKAMIKAAQEEMK